LTADLVFLDLPRRLAKLLLEQPRSPQGVVELGLSQEQIAHLVGGSRQSVNSALSGFSRRGWIAQEGSAFTILGSDALANFAGAPAPVA
jgi:CRP-like cAMP-binding protein